MTTPIAITLLTAGMVALNIYMKGTFARIRTSEKNSNMIAFAYSLLFSVYAASVIVLFIVGFLSFIGGLRAPCIMLVVLWILTSVFLFDQTEIIGNLVIDALLYGFVVVSVSSVSVAGLLKVIMGMDVNRLAVTWLIVFLVTLVVIRIVFWFFKEENHGQGNWIKKY